MMDHGDYAATAGLAETALAFLEEHDLAAEPANFAVWYTYAEGGEPQLNMAVDAILRSRRKVTPADMIELRRTLARLTGNGAQDAVDTGEITDAPTDDLIASTLHEAAVAAREMVRTRDALPVLGMRNTGRDLVARLVAATRIIEQSKRRIEAELARSRAEMDVLQADLDNVRHESLNDRLTTLASRKHFDEALAAAIADARTKDEPLSLLFTDIDHFKSFNDRYGHQTGDHVLRVVALAVKQNIRGQDTACRYGGEEFAIILPRTTADEAAEIGETIREAVMSRDLRERATGEALRPVTISIGIASFRPGDSSQSMIGRADDCLYVAKSGGRNLVVGEARPRRRVVA